MRFVLLRAVLIASGASCFAQTGLETTTFKKAQLESAGMAILQSSLSGQYVYDKPPAPSASGSRYSMGRPFDFDPVLFSAQEQEVLWKLRRRLTDEAATAESGRLMASATAHARKYQRPRSDHLNWPRVVVKDHSICVPTLEFSDVKDWKSHLVCFDSETKDVR